MNTDQVYANIEHYFPKGYNPDEEPWKSIKAFHKAAVEKVTRDYESRLRSIEDALAGRPFPAAHASGDVTQKIIDLAYRVICEHSGECEVEDLPNEMQCISDGAATGHTSEVKP